MPAVEVLDGEAVREWFRLAADALGRTAAAIDTLNVFPLPDSDTGTNLHRTIASAADAVAGLPAQASAAEVWQAAATAALLGACGNSGIIVSQLLRGLADTCAPASPCDGPVVAAALASAAALARAAVLRPVEGTVLTVADAAAAAAARASGLAEVSLAAARGARQALAGTPRQLAVLAASGVVDAGGAGLCVVLDALCAAVTGTRPEAWEVPAPGHSRAPHAPPIDAAPRFEVTFLIDADEPAVADLRARLGSLGDSVVTSGRDRQWHVHVHAAEAGAAIEAGLAVGRLSKITITSLNEAPSSAAVTSPVSAVGDACGVLPAGADSRPAAAARAVTPGDAVSGSAPAAEVVAVAEGVGLRAILAKAGAIVVAADAQELGARGVREERHAVDSLADGLSAIAATRAEATLIIGTDRLDVPWPAGWPVIEARSPVHALAAVAVHDTRNEQAADLAAMRRAVAGVRSASIAEAGPGAAGYRFGGWIDGHLAVTGADQAQVAVALVDMLVGEAEMITVVTGQDAAPGLSGAVRARVARAAPSADVVCYDGGMTSALLVIGAE